MPKRSSVVRPEPVPVNVVCSLCGEAWVLHQETDGEVSTLECIRLLKAKANRIGPAYLPYPVYPRPIYPTLPYWQINTCQTTGGNIGRQAYTTTYNACEQRTPTVALASAAA